MSQNRLFGNSVIKQGFSEITSDWSIPREAEFFMFLIHQGKITYEKAKIDILMTDEQLHWLIREHCGAEWCLRRIQELRKRTLACLDDLLKKESLGKAAVK